MSYNFNNNTKRNKKKRYGSESKGMMNGVTRISGQGLILYKHIVPDYMVVPLKYYWAAALLKDAGSRVASYEFRINAPYDVDAGLGTTSTVGFNEWTALFGNYRVLRVHAHAEFCNLDAVSTYVAMNMGNVSFANNTFTQSEWQNDYTVSAPLGQTTGMNVRVLTLDHNLVQIVGDPSCLIDDDYASAAGGIPNQIVYLNMAADSGNSSLTQTLGVAVRLELTMWTHFFKRLALSA